MKKEREIGGTQLKRSEKSTGWTRLSLVKVLGLKKYQLVSLDLPVETSP